MSYYLSQQLQAQIVHTLVEGNSIRGTARLVGVDRETVMNLGVRAGDACAQLHDGLVRRVNASRLELDEAWAFVGCKQKRCDPEFHPYSYGDQYTFVAFDADTKLVISYLTGKRSAENTTKFAFDLRERVIGRPQISTDGFTPYYDSIERAFGSQVDHGVVIKTFESDASKSAPAAHRYSPGRVIACEKFTVRGNPDEDTINTAYVERQNLTMRMSIRRMTRLTNAFSKKYENLRAAIALHFAHYNLCRIHETIRVTPAMAAGITDHVWSIEEMLGFAFSIPSADDPYGMDRDCAA